MPEFSPSIRQWYRQNGRNLPWRSTKDPYKIWLSEIILQQTRVDQGLTYYEKFVRNYPDVSALALADEQEVLNDWQGLGYYSRARNLHAAARFIHEELEGQFPSTYDKIRELKGVGDYTAAAIASFAFGEAKAVVDGNVYRLLSRCFDVDTPIDSGPGKRTFQELANQLLDPRHPGEHNQAIMELGARVCSPKPRCNECPIATLCLAKERNTIADRPVKSKRTKVKDRYFHFLIYRDGADTFLERRNTKDIWQHLYQFPLIETPEQLSEETLHLLNRADFVSEEIIHLLSHQKIHARFYHFHQGPDVADSQWIRVSISSLQDYPIPRLLDRYLEKKPLD